MHKGKPGLFGKKAPAKQKFSLFKKKSQPPMNQMDGYNEPADDEGDDEETA